MAEYKVKYGYMIPKLGRKILPNGYTEVGFLKLTSGQYFIQTNITTNAKWTLHFRFDDTKTSQRMLFGYDSNRSFFGKRNNTYYELANTQLTKSLSGKCDELVYDYLVQGQPQKLEINGESFTANSVGAITTGFGLFNLPPNYMTAYQCYGDFVDAVGKDANGNTISNLIPCMNSSNTLGVYDTIRGLFFPNEKTGVFGYEQLPQITLNSGDIVIAEDEMIAYKYDGANWNFYFKVSEPLVFKGMTFEQTDLWQLPEFVFRGLSFELADKEGGFDPLLFGSE